MSTIPFLDRLGDALERAVATRAAARRVVRGWVVAVAAFGAVLAAGALWWQLVLRDSAPPIIATTTTATMPEAEADELPGFVPADWAQVPHQEAFAGEGRTLLSGVTVWEGGFIAVGTRNVGGAVASEPPSGANTGIVVSSPDGVSWSSAAEFAAASLQDVAAGSGGLAAVGMKDFGPFAAFSADGRTWTPGGPGVVAGEDVAQMNAVTAFGDGFVAVGVAHRAPDERSPFESRAAVWITADGKRWERVAAGSFPWVGEADLSDVTLGEPGLVAVGVYSEEEGTSRAVAWLSTDGADWTRHAMPSDGDGFVSASAVTASDGGFVAVGSEDDATSSASPAAVWTSPDGREWERRPGPEEVLLGRPEAAARMHDVIRVTDGFVAVGHTLERPLLRHVLWTATPDLEWTRFDLAYPESSWPESSAGGVAATGDRVVVVGWQSSLNVGSGVGTVWIGPAPAGMPAGVPITAPEPPPDVETEITAALDPSVAVATTQVRATGRLPDGEGPARVWLLPDDGSPVLACEVPLRGRRFLCTFIPGQLDAGLPPGEYGVAVGTPDDVITGLGLVVMPPESTVVTLSGLYQATLWPLLQSLTVSNEGAAVLDLSGWVLVDGVKGSRFVFPAGTVLDPGSSAQLDFGGPSGGTCPESTTRYFHWCSIASDDGRIPYQDELGFWGGGGVTLVDTTETTRAEWRRP